VFRLKFPKLVKVHQIFSSEKIANIREHLLQQLSQKLNSSHIKPNASIAITVGSRGITNRVLIVKTVVEFIKQMGARPFIIGAMGSHGGGTPEGQMDVIKSLGFTEEKLGCPIVTSSTVVEVGQTDNDLIVYCDEHAWAADGIIVMNRIKPHTSFRGPNESGLLKMITVGLGKAKGAAQLHRQGPAKMSETIRAVGGAFLKTGKVIAGIGIVENSFDETAKLEVLLPEEIIPKEQELLVIAKDYLPRLPVENLDLLVVKRMGKNFSGTGMDTNVIGRTRIFGVSEPESPRIARIAVLDLDDASHGNATGIGLADFTTERLYRKIDKQATYLNCLTSTYVQRAMIPIVLETDREAILAAIQSLALEDVDQLRIAVIDNTLDLETLYLSETVFREASHNLEPLSEPMEITFDRLGALTLAF
jgi:hypothetical protein